jgi:hypothetical protein
LSTRAGRARRAAGALTIATLALGGTAACGESDPEVEAATAEDLRQVEDDLAALDQRVGVLEGGAEGDSPDDGGGVLPGVGLGDLLEDPQSFLGREVTVSGEISRLWTTADMGAAFQIAGETGDPITVISAGQRDQLDANDDVEVTGTVTSIDEDTFERDFGIAADELLEDPDGFLTDVAGEPAIAASRVEILQPSDG